MITPKIDLSPVPAAWESIRTIVSMRAENRPVIIAGGAMRDHLLGIPVNDLDVFILEITHEKAAEIFNADIYCSPYDGKMHSQHQHETIGHIDVDLVFTVYKTSKEVLDDFDLGICKAAWDGANFIIHDDFVRDVSRGIVSVSGAEFGNHRERLIQKLTPYGFEFQRPRNRLP
jgi:hypothetical protein